MWQNPQELRIRPHLVKKFLMGNSTVCAVSLFVSLNKETGSLKSPRFIYYDSSNELFFFSTRIFICYYGKMC